jgi:membrane protein implicated in regulation of membrane protease activity
MRLLLAFLLLIHGIIHLFGFLKAYNLHQFEQLTQPVSRPQGLLWLLAGLLFAGAVVLYLNGIQLWHGVALAAILLSQFLIFSNWGDARFGTVANLLILVPALLSWQSYRFEHRYLADVQAGIERTQAIQEDLLTGEDLQQLPVPVQRYLRYTGTVGQPKVHSFRARFKAEMRGKGQDWMRMDCEQYNFFDTDERLFFLKAKVKGLPAQGYHRYQGHEASMDVRLFSVVPVAQAEGPEMFVAETVTMFNDMCFLAPATLIDKRIKWEAIDRQTVQAHFTNKGTTIRARLFFNDYGQLINFESFDRYDINAMEQYRFTTPLSNYKRFGNHRLASYGEATWHYPDGPFVYGKFTLKKVVYNP